MGQLEKKKKHMKGAAKTLKAEIPKMQPMTGAT